MSGNDSRMPDAIQNPTYPQFTNLALNEGLVDQLMTTVNHHLNEQYKKQRISGADFAQVYTGSIGHVLQFATQYLLGILLIDEQKADLSASASLKEKQEEKIEGELALIELERIKLKYQIEELLPLEKARLELEVEKVRQEGLLIAAQILKIDAEIDYLVAQEAMLLKQAEKIDKEIEFLDAKILTERANTEAGIAASDSLIGKQKELLSAQKLGFAGDIQVKAAKVHADYDAVFQSVQEVPQDVLLHAPATTLLSKADTTAASILAI